ncbi:putative transcriptional regulator, LysR family [Bradyrhizobium sp. ORS 285]|uniref:LysR family transcriptional regulator n=1 Tax=Bradyrhizobium sp. ORS 285 TaxID=115808 RepID=UPI0002409A14|nr:LysR family transcriptional regulator [Bradyrhizobium sp. ORS 285]CCD85191.1 putative transcriptional regulator, LysR family [Bradyrhizobium sp. ORS 285]SMX58169.1 putative transcriptional regulator, LysR family [Bradyrhizobium sp. ORS 285]
MTPTLDIAAVRTFLLVSDLQSFTRAAEALGTTQAAVSLKLQRLEAVLGKRLLERSPRAVRLTADGAAFVENARALVAAHDVALAAAPRIRPRLALGISDHAAGPELVPMLQQFHAITTELTLSVGIGFSRDLLDRYDAGTLDAIIIRQEASRRGGETLADDEFGWFASPRFRAPAGTPLPLATLAAPCGVRALAVRALDKAKWPYVENFVGGGVAAVVAAAQAGLAVAPLARRIAPAGLVDHGPALGLPKLGRSKVILHAKVSDAAKRAALRTLAAAFRSASPAK